MRDLTTDMVTELTAPVMQPVLLAMLGFDSGTLYIWSGYGDMIWDGNTYTGGGNLVQVSSMKDTQDLQAQGINCILNGIPSDIVSLALSERTRGRPFRLYLGMVAPGNVLVTSPYRLFTGLMDVMEMTDNGQTSSLTLSVENRLIVGQRKKVRRYTAEDQKKIYPDDKGFDKINSLQDKEVIW